MTDTTVAVTGRAMYWEGFTLAMCLVLKYGCTEQTRTKAQRKILSVWKVFSEQLIEQYTVDVYRYKTIESTRNSFVTCPKGISYRFYWYYL